MKIFLSTFLCLQFLSCASIQIEDTSFITGKWKLENRVNEELWLERIDSNDDNLAMFTFLKSGLVYFFRKKIKSKEQMNEEVKKKGYCGNDYTAYKSYNTLFTKATWKLKSDTIKVTYTEKEKVLRKDYLITHISTDKLDIREVVSN